MTEINFSSMCHIFVISRGLRGHSLLNECIVAHVQRVLTSAEVLFFPLRTPPLLPVK